MDKLSFKQMWEKMQKEGYFSNHPHYTHDHQSPIGGEEKKLDEMLLSLDFSQEDFVYPVAYSEALERSVKRTEAYWLPMMFDLPEQGRALDVGCGYGRTLRWMSEVYEQVVGVDISEEVITQAKKHFLNSAGVELFPSGPDHLPVELSDDSFDLVYVFTVFQHIPREYTAALLKDIARVLKPQGKVAFNLLSNINEDLDDGEFGTEWAIGYRVESVNALLEELGLRPEKITRWSSPGYEVAWLWVLATKA
jgi:SAM-dependent methyltransferase